MTLVIMGYHLQVITRTLSGGSSTADGAPSIQRDLPAETTSQRGESKIVWQLGFRWMVKRVRETRAQLADPFKLSNLAQLFCVFRMSFAAFNTGEGPPD